MVLISVFRLNTNMTGRPGMYGRRDFFRQVVVTAQPITRTT